MSDELQEMQTDSSMVALLNKSEIDTQISTAHKFPRSLKKFKDEAMEMVTLSANIAADCFYAVPRDKKTIEGPSARFAEVIVSAWGNSRAGARVVSDQGDFVTAQGVFHDLERNVAITYEVQRRITNKEGRRFSADMIMVTANAACSIALRNAILKGIPKAFWSEMYEAARRTAVGDFKSLSNKRASAIEALQVYGVTPLQIYALLEIEGKEDMSADHLRLLFGIMTAIKEGDTTPEEAFPIGKTDKPALAAYPDEKFKTELSKWRESIKAGKETADNVVAKTSSRYVLSEEQVNAIKAPFHAENATPFTTYAQVADMMNKAEDMDTLAEAADLVGEVQDKEHRAELSALFKQLEAKFKDK